MANNKGLEYGDPVDSNIKLHEIRLYPVWIEGLSKYDVVNVVDTIENIQKKIAEIKALGSSRCVVFKEPDGSLVNINPDSYRQIVIREVHKDGE